MYFDFRTFFRVAYLSFFKWRESPARLTVKRALFLVGFFLIFPMVQIFNVFCFFLDQIFFPGYQKIEIEKPVFIIGNPRSGTTFIHRVMARDEEQFFYFRTWEIIFPAIIQKKFLFYVGCIDRWMGSILSHCLNYFESWLFPNFGKMHKLGLFYPEEDDKVLVHIFSFFELLFFFPFKELDWLSRFDQLARPEDRKRIMTFYGNCIRRQAYFKGCKKHFLSKSPHSSARIDSLFEHFPDCKIVYMVRNPLEVVPSTVNMVQKIWGSAMNMKAGFPLQEKIYETTKFYYQHPLARLERAPQDSYVIVNYEELVNQPSKVVQTIYQQFGFELSTEFLQALREEDEKAKGYKSSHVYSLDQCCYTREQIVSDLWSIFERFHFDTRESPGQ